ncbi:hypothetical protein [Bradyrhizobium cenepequi]|uniref:hypothetical protein n=1 Tax=Bradyrhizobium cenepequi TaxID=2821403 RepID=UPI001CE322DE|nr:hypothetical protein [Bradyrhizobium cenepequi]MCA6113091.1 hypothetical protein [Bradyrhizobium cenepequi]
MNVWTGIISLGLALVLILAGLPNRDGVHRRFLRFHAAMVLYPPIVLVLAAFGIATIISSLLTK